MTGTDPCDCGLSGDSWQCINGVMYGPCGHEDCGGVCEPYGDCRCQCHQQTTGETA